MKYCVFGSFCLAKWFLYLSRPHILFSLKVCFLVQIYCRIRSSHCDATVTAFVSDFAPRMAFWTDNMSNISDEELFKDDLRLDSILAKAVTVSEDLLDRGRAEQSS